MQTSTRPETLPHAFRIAAITGAASGIGEAAARQLARDGFGVALIDRDLDKLRAVAQAVEATGGQALALQADVCDAASVDRAFSAIEQWRGAPAVLVNSAGIMTVVPALECSELDFQRVMDVNVTGTFRCCQRAAPAMVAHGYGRIVNLASISSVRAGVGRIAYGTSKAAIAGLTRQLAMELGGHGVTVNSVAPGPIATALTLHAYTADTRRAFESSIPAKRFGTVSEVAHAISFLSSEGAAYVNGVLLPVDGGYLAAGIATTGGVQV